MAAAKRVARKSTFPVTAPLVKKKFTLERSVKTKVSEEVDELLRMLGEEEKGETDVEKSRILREVGDKFDQYDPHGSLITKKVKEEDRPKDDSPECGSW